jgi:hypothetical protein
MAFAMGCMETAIRASSVDAKFEAHLVMHTARIWRGKSRALDA